MLIVAKAGPGCYDIDIAHAGFCVQRCYACGRLYPDIRFRVGWLLSQGPYDPTDYDCGCIDRLVVAREFPCGEFENGDRRLEPFEPEDYESQLY